MATEVIWTETEGNFDGIGGNLNGNMTEAISDGNGREFRWQWRDFDGNVTDVIWMAIEVGWQRKGISITTGRNFDGNGVNFDGNVTDLMMEFRRQRDGRDLDVKGG
jgi:hypothetical protein